MTQTSDLGRGAFLTLTQAADDCGVSRSTLKRRLPEFANAHQDQNGTWRIPVTDLLGSGLHLRPRPVTQVSEPVTQGRDPGQNGVELAQALGRIETLTAELVSERMARQIAEVRATAYAANLEDLRLSLRAISGPPRASEAVPAPEPAPAAAEPVQAVPVGPRRAVKESEPSARRGFWARLRGS